MSEGIGIIIAVAIIAFLVWLVGKIISIALFVIIVVPIYIVLTIYAGIKFIGMSTFTAMDKLFYLGFDIPVIVVWIFWGLVIGAAIQGCREMKIYGRKGIGVLIAIAPVLLLVFAAGVKSLPGPLLSDVPTNVAAAKRQSIESQKEQGANIKVNTTPILPLVTEGMVLIPAGEFEMGSNNGETDEGPVHTVHVDAFYMDRHEVTNAQYAAFLNVVGEAAAGSYYPGDGSDRYDNDMIQIQYIDGRYASKPGYENHPVSGVTWHGAMAYAAWVRKRLPTEAEWEKAARGGLVGMAYPWGDTIDAGKANYNQNVSETTVGTTTPVGRYPANGYGLYDMAGNVLEWCLDEYDKGFYTKSPDKNPLAGDSFASILTNWANIESPRVIRGGCWNSDTDELRGASRSYGGPRGDHVSLFSGFRCVKGVLSSDKE